MKIAKLLTIFITLFYLSVGVVLANKQQPVYSIEKHSTENGDVKSVLALYSVPQNSQNESLKRINTFTDIIESHWNVEIEVENYQNVNYSTLNDYSYLMLIELNAETQAANFFANIINTTTAQTLWIGYGTEAIISGAQSSNTIPFANEVKYKEESFSVDQELPIFALYPDFLSNFEILAEYTDENNDNIENYPFIGILNDQHLVMPFDLPHYYSVTNHSLPMLDTLHYVFGHHQRAENQPALMRLEDVNVHTYQYPSDLHEAFNFLVSVNAPFHLAFIERYVNPGEEIDWNSSQSKRYLKAIKDMVRSGNVVLVQHGYTHQVNNGISGIGFEFWDAQTNGPLPNETPEYAKNKINGAREAMTKLGLPVPDIWETPHYTASELSNEVFNQMYPIRYEHIPNIGSLPFAVKRDDTIFIPENLGYIYRGNEDLKIIEKRLQQLNTFEDPVASGFWHPWRDIAELKQYVALVQKNGFEFVLAYDLLTIKNPQSVPMVSSSLIERIYFYDVVFYTVLILFVIGGIHFLRNVYFVRKHIKLIDDFSLSMDELKSLAKEKEKNLPRIGVFIPARNEALVIENTIKNVAAIEYPKHKMKVFIIVDKREEDDNVIITTKEVATKIAKTLHKQFGRKFIYIIEVPKWYSGLFGNRKHTYAKSTKGRALNYCLQKITRFNLDLIGVLDADGRLNQNVLKEVAYKRLKTNSKMLQGSVFQVSNFSKVSIVGIAAGLELALHHLTEVPRRLQKNGALQFLAGTNYFVDTKSIKKARGWDQNALVEDAELALRLYLSENIVGDWLHSPELEQTPARFSVYRKQRERWVRGHISILKQIYKSPLSLKEKLYFFNKILASQFRFIFDLGLPILSLYLLLISSLIIIHPIFIYVATVLFFVSFFVWDTYGFMYRQLSHYIDPNMKMNKKLITSVKLFLFLPIFILVQTVPRIEAFYNIIFHPEKVSWYKTERTVEAELT